jgi:hypothetical protein
MCSRQVLTDETRRTLAVQHRMHAPGAFVPGKVSDAGIVPENELRMYARYFLSVLTNAMIFRISSCVRRLPNACIAPVPPA